MVAMVMMGMLASSTNDGSGGNDGSRLDQCTLQKRPFSFSALIAAPPVTQFCGKLLLFCYHSCRIFLIHHLSGASLRASILILVGINFLYTMQWKQ